MKLTPASQNHRGYSEHGSAVLILLAFLTIMLIFCTVTTHAIFMTRDELKLIEKHQIARLAATTNAPPAQTKSMTAP